MSRPRLQSLALLVAALWLATAPLAAQRGTQNGEWRFYGGDAGSTKYSPLDQINAETVAELEIAWRWKANNFGPRPDYNWEVTPLMVGGALYFTAGSRRDAIAVDALTGETLPTTGCFDSTRESAGTAPSVRRTAGWPTGPTERTTNASC